METTAGGFKGKIEFIIHKLQNNDLGFRLLIGLIAWFSLATFIQFREIKIDMLELESIANRYIVAQVDFEFPDEEAMVILRQEAISDLGNIYQIDDKILKQIIYDLEYFFVHDSSWKGELQGVALEDIYRILDTIKTLLKDERFTDSLTLSKMKALQIDIGNFFVFSMDGSNNTKKELPKEYWEFLRKKAEDGANKAVLNYIVNFLQKKTWILEIDKKADANLREYVEESVPQKFTKIQAGSTIISQGEKVRSRHMEMLKAMKLKISETRNIWAPFSLIGSLLMALIFIVISGMYIKFYQIEVLRSLQKLSLLVCIFILTLAFAKIIEYVLMQSSGNIVDAIHYPLIVPFIAILLLILFNSRLALFFVSILSVILTANLTVDHINFLIINLIASMVIIVTTKSLRKRKEVFEICGKSLLGAIPVILAFKLSSKTLLSYSFINDVGLTLLLMMIIAILVVGLLPILESLFNVLTDITLMEYMDPNNELLKRLTLEMPGTYQHSLVLGNLAETAAQAIGANALLCRVATLYHDVGKLHNAHFFTENQQTGVNIHQLLTPLESAQVIISHVKDGVMLAKKYRLPQLFIDIMQQHHGTMLVYFFYRKEVELHGGDASKVDESNFRYPGPKPLTKEAAIIMIADGVEAASRSLEELTEDNLLAMINGVVKNRADDGQFDECDLTFQELGIIKKTLAKTLIVTRHVRIKYPEKKEDILK